MKFLLALAKASMSLSWAYGNSSCLRSWPSQSVGEGKRYYDLIRFGKAAEVLKPGGGKVLNKAKTAYDVLGIPERIQWTESKKYLPIPQDEIEAAKGTLKQNEY